MGENLSRKKFIGRTYELNLLKKEYDKESSSLIVIYGRRRVGKTRLITEFYNDKNLWKFDGIEGENKAFQLKNILEQISFYTGDKFYKSIKCTKFLDILKILDRAILSTPKKHNITILLDEFQYMAVRRSELVSAIKWAWDNLWYDKKGFTLILCGSVASFMIKKVIKSSSLYGRIKLEMCLKPFSLQETAKFFSLKKSIREICDLYMFLGGIPEYLLQIDIRESIFQNITRLAFCKDGYFINEFDRIFKDIFREEKIYKQIILMLAKYRSLNAKELTKMLGQKGGGGFSDYFKNLESAGFIKTVIPFNKTSDTKLKRYRLDDEYLLFYFKFIYPNLKKIENNTSIDYGISLLKSREYKTWASFAFERLCQKHISCIMKFLKIDQLVKDYGAYFNRASNNKNGVQIDLLFIRHDPVITICEMKYYEGLIGKWIIKEMENKISLIYDKTKTIEKVLITTNGITKDLKDTNYFSNVILLEDLFKNKFE